MPKPVIGVLANSHVIGDDYHIQGAGEINLNAICEAAGAIPMVIPAMPHLYDLDELRSVCAGFLFTGGRPNVHPEEYGEPETEAHGTFDRARDRLTLPLIRACVEAGQPILMGRWKKSSNCATRLRSARMARSINCSGATAS